MWTCAGLVALIGVSYQKSKKLRALLVALACFAASCVFSLRFAIGISTEPVAEYLLSSGIQLDAEQVAQLQNTLRDNASFSGAAGIQACGDAFFMSAITLIAISIAEHFIRKAGEAGLREVFAARLLVVVVSSFMVVATVAYGAVTMGEYNECQEDMQSEVNYLLGQVERTAAFNVKVYDAFMEIAEVDPELFNTMDEFPEDGMLSNLIKGYTEDLDGLVVVAVGPNVVGTDVERYDVEDCPTMPELLGDDVSAATQKSEEAGTLERVIYYAPSKYNDRLDFAFGRKRDEFEELETPQVGYLMAVEHGGYQVVMIRPASMVFAGRAVVVGWIGLSTIVLLIAVYALVWRLLDRLVARRIDATNATLERITDGDLDARVQPEGTREFWDLSAGINVTVDALQGWIAEAEKRMDAELATAKAIQESALPSVFPPYPDIQRFDIYASMNAAKEMGGDFYDFFLIGEDSGPDAGKLAFVLADVSGKGVSAALFMMKAKTQIHDYLDSGMELGEAIENANHQLCDGNDEGMFVTAWVGVLDYATRHIEYVNAGHNPPLLWQDGSWQWMKTRSGLPLGLFDGMPYRTFTVDCEVGDQLLIYTDGVTEAFSVDDEKYGEERLLNLVEESYDLHPRSLVQSVRTSVAAFSEGAEQSDDITILALEIGVPPEEKAQLVVPANLEEMGRVEEFIHAGLNRRLCPVRIQHQLNIALEEMFVNSCNYAYQNAEDDVERYVRVTHSYSANPASLTVEIIDDGEPFDPLAKPDATLANEYASSADIPIGGLGILMAKKSVDEMRYERVGDSNVVTLVKCW